MIALLMPPAAVKLPTGAFVALYPVSVTVTPPAGVAAAVPPTTAVTASFSEVPAVLVMVTVAV